MKTFAHKPFVRIAHKSLAYILVFCIVNMPVWALNAGDAVVSVGSADITGAANTVSVDLLTNQAVLEWTQMNATSAETLNFNGSSGFAVLNRVASAVDFNGTLNGAGGHIFVVSPHGVIIGPDATITASSFTASSLNITNGDFMNSIYKFSGDGAGEVSNYGSISAQQVALIGKQILNAGTISSPGGYTVLAAGDTVYLNPEGSNVVVEVSGVALPDAPAVDGIGDVINEGTIEAIDGQIIMAAGDTFSRAIEGVDQMTVAVESGIGRVGQFGTLNANGSDGNGGNITLTAADSVVLGQDSVTTANAGLNGDGGSIVVYSPDTAMLRGGVVEAKGGIESGNGGFAELSGKQYFEMYGTIDLSASAGRDGTVLFDPYNITIVPGTGNDLATNGDVWQPTGDSSTLGIITLEELLGTSNVILSTIGTVGMGSEDGDIIFAADKYLTTSRGNDNSFLVDAFDDIIFQEGNGILFRGNGDVELFAQNGSVTSVDRGKIPNIWTQGGDIIIQASSGIDMGSIQAGSENTTGPSEVPGEIRLTTTDGGDINLQHLNVEGTRYGSVYVNSSGDLNIMGEKRLGGAVKVKTNTASVGFAARSFICLIAEGDVNIQGDVYAEAHGDLLSRASIWIGAGTHIEDPINGYNGTVTVNGVIQADSTASGALKSDSTVRVYGSTVILQSPGGQKAVQATAQSKTTVTADEIDTTDPDYENPYLALAESDDVEYIKLDDNGFPVIEDGGFVIVEDPDHVNDNNFGTRRGDRALIVVDVLQDGSCLNCTNRIRIVLPVAVNDLFNTGHNLKLDIVVLSNDKENELAPEGSLTNGTIHLETFETANGGTVTLINNDTEISYTPPPDGKMILLTANIPTHLSITP